MHNVNDLRRALAGSVEELSVDLPLDGVTARARTLRQRRTALATAAVATLAVTVSVAVWLPGGPGAGVGPGGSSAVITHPSVDPSFPAVGDSIGTGIRVGPDEEVVLWFTPVPVGPGVWVSLFSGINDQRTGQVHMIPWYGQTPITPGRVAPGKWQMYQLYCGDGRVIDFGFYVGPADRITVEIHGDVTEARWTRWSRDPSVTVFWAERRGFPMPNPTAPDPSGPPTDPERPRFTAYRNGQVLSTSLATNRALDPSSWTHPYPSPILPNKPATPSSPPSEPPPGSSPASARAAEG